MRLMGITADHVTSLYHVLLLDDHPTTYWVSLSDPKTKEPSCGEAGNLGHCVRPREE